MPIAAGINHIATLSTSLERTFEFYRAVFEAAVTFTMEAADDHPRMWIFDLGGGRAGVGRSTTSASRSPRWRRWRS